jgi:hypothetical protein
MGRCCWFGHAVLVQEVGSVWFLLSDLWESFCLVWQQAPTPVLNCDQLPSAYTCLVWHLLCASCCTYNWMHVQLLAELSCKQTLVKLRLIRAYISCAKLPIGQRKHDECSKQLVDRLGCTYGASSALMCS